MFSSSNSTYCTTGEEGFYVMQGELSDSCVPQAFSGILCYRFPIAGLISADVFTQKSVCYNVK